MVKALENIRKKLHMTAKLGSSFTYCGERITQSPLATTVDQWPAAAALEPITLAKERQKQCDEPLAAEERTGYGQLM